jgi:cell cycle sensor histidine kinase DivJ
LRTTPATFFSGLYGPDLVHDSVRDDETERSRHRHFIVTRLVVGACGLACFPPYLALRGAPTWLDAVLALALAGPIFAAAIASLTARLVPAAALSAASLAGLVFCLAAASPHVPWAIVLWLMVEPIDALLSGLSRSALVAACVSLSALPIMVVTGFWSADAFVSAPPAALALGFLAATAVVQAGGQVLRLGRLEGARRLAEATREIEERSLFDVVGDLVTWHGRSGEVVRASASAARFVGASAKALQGQGLIRQVHVSDRPAFLRALSDASNQAEPVTAEFRLHVEPGSGTTESRGRVIWVEMRAQRIEAGDTAVAVVSVMRDMSAQRQHAEELESARREAERANELKGRFLATVTHELRTPLNAIIGFSELLVAEHPYVITEERRKEYAAIIRDSGHHLLEVVNTLLDMSKIETGNFNFEPETFDLGELARGCCDLMRLRADEAEIELKLQLAGSLPELTGDRRACRQILINLLSNAVKFTPAGGAVTVSVQRDHDRLVLSVSDTGIGIGEGDLPRLGDAFFQAGDAYRRPHDGTGLGLSVVRGLVGLHRGSLMIESGAGAGTTVTVSLPIDGCDTRLDSKPATVRTRVRPRPAALSRLSA